MPQAGFELRTWVFEWVKKVHVLDRAATVIRTAIIIIIISEIII
jgi:hypothetical protein